MSIQPSPALASRARSVDAIEKLAAARGVPTLVTDASDTAKPLFEARGYQADAPQHDRNRWRISRQHAHDKSAAAQSRGGRAAMTREKLTLFDTTLRDGAQMAGVDFSLADKRHIAALLDGLGLDYIEGGYPGANPLDTEFFAQRPKLKNARFAAFGMTKRAGRSAANDPGLADLLNADADVITFVAKAWDFHVLRGARLHA